VRRFLLTLVAVIAALAAASALAVPPPARADGDPASDVLVTQNVYYPVTPPTSPALARVLDRLTAEAKRTGYAIKVALIASPDDLGAVPQLFAQPERYARFLGGEITFNTRQPLLVVMPGGFGSYQAGAGAAAALAPAPRPTAPTGDALATAAIGAVTRLARAAGHPVAAPALPGGAELGRSRAGGAPWWAFVAPLLLVAGGVAVLTRRRREPAAEGVES